MAQSIKLHPRRCCITGEGMDSGYLINDGEMYIKYESDMIKHIREVEKKGNPDYDVLVSEGSLTDDFLLHDYYEHEYYYYTDWECPDDIQFVEVDGVFYEEGEEEFDKYYTLESEKVTPNDGLILTATYIDYLNKDKNFKQDRIEFESYDDAVKWAKENFEKFNPDMINYKLKTN
tara:strand:- start:1582 stop:2106 length:525 start_codon:yes stop_codon:yes gene_type:complete